MTGDRYLVIVPDAPEALDSWRPHVASLAAELGFVTSDMPRCLTMTERAGLTLHAAGGSHGLIIGMLVRRGDRMPSARLTPAEASAIVRSRGEALIASFWGNYIAVTAGPSGVDILRAPFGDLACYYARGQRATILASDLDLLAQVTATRPGIDWDAIARQLIAPDIRRATTCLCDVFELSGGDRLMCAEQIGCETLWTPWTFVAGDRRCDDRDQAAAMVADAILNAVAAGSSRLSRSVLLLSGGVDSSIMAAALTHAGHSFTALNLVTNSAAGDERADARRVADHCGFELHEVTRDTASVDVKVSAAADRPYPIERSFAQATSSAAARIAEATGARAVLHGGGGDNIFCSLQSSAPLADLLSARGLDRRAAALTRDIAAVAHATSSAVVKQALIRLLVRRRQYRWQSRLALLSSAGLAFEAEAIDHPWLNAPRGVLSGSASHVGLLLAALGVAQSPSVTTRLPWAGLLLAQPVIEACLTVPSWLWFERGCNRAIARRAFAPMLPEANSWRPTKGAMDSFMIEIFEANRAQIRSMLMDGKLVRSGLIDRAGLLSLLDDPGPVRGKTWGSVLQFADVEAWVDARA